MLPSTEETDLFCLPPLDAAALLFDAPWRRFAMIGDSLSAGHPINNRANLLSADGIHFSASGQAVMASEVVKQLAHQLGRRVPA
jgi:lysophospholipase L1-like esterase